jgi:cell division protein FtsI (penicillin-binding protein 3)
MPHLSVPKSREAPPAKVALKPEPKPKPEKSAVLVGLEKLEQMDAVTEDVAAEGSVRVPDVKGLAGRAAVAQLLTAALEPHLAGSGRVVSQKPAAGALVEKGTRITVELAGHLPASPR